MEAIRGQEPQGRRERLQGWRWWRFGVVTVLVPLLLVSCLLKQERMIIADLSAIERHLHEIQKELTESRQKLRPVDPELHQRLAVLMKRELPGLHSRISSSPQGFGQVLRKDLEVLERRLSAINEELLTPRAFASDSETVAAFRTFWKETHPTVFTVASSLSERTL